MSPTAKRPSADLGRHGDMRPARRPTLAEARVDIRRVVHRSRSSFGWGMRILAPARREAMHALYAFCRRVDDIADGTAPPAEKLERLLAWRQEIDALYAGHPTQSVTIALAAAIDRFDLPQAEFHRILDGMELDAAERMKAPPFDLLMHYCRCVAGAVGLLSIRIFGARDAQAEAFALALGDALQLTNILRDIDEDAARGRLYLPAEALGASWPVDAPVASLLDHPLLPGACEALAETARGRYATAERALARCNRSELRPAIVMMGIYRQIFDRLALRGWTPPRRRVELSRPRKLAVALRYAVLGPPCPPSMS